MLNKIWSILAKGKILTPSAYNRKVNPDIYSRNQAVEGVINTLVPYIDNLYRPVHIEECVQLLLMSDLRDRALAFDPINTYEKTKMLYPTPGEFDNLSPSARIRYFTDPGALLALGTGDIQIDCTYDGTGLDITTKDGVFPFIISNNQSSVVELKEGLKFRMYGPFSAGTSSFSITYVDSPRIEWGTILTNLEALGSLSWQDSELRQVWDTDINWINRVAAVILNAVEHSEAG
jgi:hypothetical protein